MSLPRPPTAGPYDPDIWIPSGVMIQCPNCGVLRELDKRQLTGIASIVCPDCGYHFYKTDGVWTVD